MDVATIAADLCAEQQALDDIVAPLDDASWRLATPSPRWTIADQIAHLAYFDETGAVAMTDSEAFAAGAVELAAAFGRGDLAADEFTLGPLRALSAPALLARWRSAREALHRAAATLSEDARLPWYGPPMGAKSFLTARLMETWAHGQDVVDALGGTRSPTNRLRHIARLGFITRPWSYANRSRTAPGEPVRLDLGAPGGETWHYGPDDATELVKGSAEDFCLVVTQRRHLDDTTLEATPLAREWLLIAQAFAGPATDGPAPGTR